MLKPHVRAEERGVWVRHIDYLIEVYCDQRGELPEVLYLTKPEWDLLRECGWDSIESARWLHPRVPYGLEMRLLEGDEGDE